MVRLFYAAGLLGLSLCAASWAQTSSPKVAYAPSTAPAVGEVTFAVGPIVKTSSEGVPETVQKGSRVMPGDRLDTAEGGMVHIRFVDGALVSLRPGSRLWVEDYQYDARDVSRSLVRFRLDHWSRLACAARISSCEPAKRPLRPQSTKAPS